MIATIFWELRRRRTALIWWTIGSILMTVTILALFPSIQDKAAQMNQVINQLPEGIREMKAGGVGTVDVGDPAQFLNSQLFYITLPIIWIIMAIARGAAILGREEQDGTLEMLLARPLSRTRLLLAKAAELFLEMLIVGAATATLIALLAPHFKLGGVGTSYLVTTTLLTSLFSLSFGMIAFMLQAASRLTKRAATAIAVVTSFGGYILTSLAPMTDWLKVPSKFVPYHYFEPLEILKGHVHQGLTLYLVATIFVGLLTAVTGFQKRDI